MEKDNGIHDYYQLKLKQQQLQSNSSDINTFVRKEQLDADLQRSAQLIKMINNRVAQIELIKASNVAGNVIIPMARATEPDTPCKPRTTLNMAIAGVLGFILSVLGVMIADWWKTENT